MNHNRLGRGLVAGISLFLIIPGVISTVAQDGEELYLSSSDGKWWYVGGDGLGNYSRIQDAIDTASAGDTVFVYDDSSPYYENVIINKTIELIGEERDSTIIHGLRDGCAVLILSNCITLKGFTIQHWGHVNEYSTLTIIDVNNTCIENNIIQNNYTQGIYIYSSNNNFITGNIISTDDSTCIHLSNSDNNTIKQNAFNGENLNGIYIGSSTNTSIVNNSFSQSCDISSDFSNKTVIDGNVFSIYGQQAAAIDIQGSDCLIINNIIQTHGGTGLVLYMCTKTLVSKNNFLDNQIDAICYYCIDKRISTNAGPLFSENIFDNNYWNKQRNFPKPISGLIIVFFPFIFAPWIQFDWHPAQEPYEITS